MRTGRRLFGAIINSFQNLEFNCLSILSSSGGCCRTRNASPYGKKFLLDRNSATIPIPQCPPSQTRHCYLLLGHGPSFPNRPRYCLILEGKHHEYYVSSTRENNTFNDSNDRNSKQPKRMATWKLQPYAESIDKKNISRTGIQIGYKNVVYHIIPWDSGISQIYPRKSANSSVASLSRSAEWTEKMFKQSSQR